MNVMTPLHPRWPDFCRRVLAAVPVPSSPHRHAHNRTATTAVLAELDVDVLASLDALAEQGGRTCDCEVIMNVILPSLEPEP